MGRVNETARRLPFGKRLAGFAPHKEDPEPQGITSFSTGERPLRR
jgi:hypothetical protein